MRAFYFYSVILGFFVGILAGELFDFSLEAGLASLLSAILIAVFLFWHSSKKEKLLAHPILIFAIFMFTFSIGGMRMQNAESKFNENPLSEFLDKKTTLTGYVDNETESSNSTIVKVYAIQEGNYLKNIKSEKILVNNLSPLLGYRDIVVFSGKLNLPKNFKTQSGSEFDYATYLKKSGIRYVVSFPTLISQEKDNSFSIRAFLYRIKNWFIGNIQSVVPEPESALAAGVTVAGKAALPANVKEDFIRSGVIHIVVLSGYNIAIIIGAMLAMFGFLGRRWASIIAITAVSLFVILSGGAAPVVRAAIMAGIVLIGTLSYTPVIQNRALFGAALLMVLWNPLILSSDASFALSFLATFAIINIARMVEPYLSLIGKRFQMRKILSETLATQVFVLPYLLYQIGRLSVVAPLSNIVILPFIPAIMLLCFIVGVIAFAPFVALPLAGALFVLSWLVIWLAHAFASLPFASFDISISLWTMLLMYLGYFAIGIYFSRRAHRTD
ncbi:MAG TPA: ComEC/Rec2 family competence protein [Candidatus Paceibacterota bacterium]